MIEDFTFAGHALSIKYLQQEINKQLLEQKDPEKHKRYRTILSNFLGNDDWHTW